MNINYAEIIERANARKDALEAFASRMRDAPEQAHKLSAALTFFAHLKNDCAMLDAEAKELAKAQHAVALDFAHRTTNFAEQLNFAHDGKNTLFGRFVSACEEFK